MNKEGERRQILQDAGLNPDDVKLWVSKWRNLKTNTLKQEYDCLLEFQDYISLAVKANISDPRVIGKRIDSYAMGRYGDHGNYEVGNCRFITVRQNLDERRINGGDAVMSMKKLGRHKGNDEGMKRMAESLKGRNKQTHEYLSRMADKLRGRSKFTHSHIEQQAIKVSKIFTLQSPDGKIVEGVNLKQFCEDNNLDQGAMAKVCRGHASHHKGWTGKYREVNGV